MSKDTGVWNERNELHLSNLAWISIAHNWVQLCRDKGMTTDVQPVSLLHPDCEAKMTKDELRTLRSMPT